MGSFRCQVRAEGDHRPDQRVTPLLDPGLLARLERLQLATRRPLAGRFAGEHRSRRHGTSLDFADYRPYHPGDDFRRIDYHLYARLDVLVLKLFEAEDDLTVRLLVDTSASMAGAKLAQAARVAAALGFVALVRRDVVTVHTLPAADRPGPATAGSPGDLAARRFLGRGAVAPLFDHLAGLAAAGPSPLVAAAADLLARPGPAGVTVLISDLLTPEWSDALRRLPARGGHLVVVHVLDRDELDPPLMGDLQLVDRETGARMAVSLSPARVAEYRRAARAWADDVVARAVTVNAGYVRLFADDDLAAALLGGWRAEGVLR
jgi:uncharacterized protein (DUF58 family)